MSETPVYGLVLAGGKSRRMGADKALLQQDGESQLARAVRLLSAVCAQVYVSAREEQASDPERSRYPLIIDRYDDAGPLAGIVTAMGEHRDVDWLVVACDLPNLSVPLLESLVSERDQRYPFVAYRSSHNGLPEPLCSVYRAGSDAILKRFLDDGIRCPRKIMINSETRLLDQADPDSLDNMNTPDDLERSGLTMAATQ